MSIYCPLVIYPTIIRISLLDITLGVFACGCSLFFFFLFQLALSELFSVSVMPYSAVAALLKWKILCSYPLTVFLTYSLSFRTLFDCTISI